MSLNMYGRGPKWLVIIECVKIAGAHTDPVKREDVIDKGNEELDPRIMLGEDGYPGEFPWMTYITYDHVDDGTPLLCGGAIVSHRHILTAGHCCRFAAEGTIVVRVGELNLNRDPDCDIDIFFFLGIGCTYYIRDYKVEKAIPYTPYSDENFQGDICIIRVTEDIAFNSYINKIELPFGDGRDFSKESFEGREEYIAGWGKKRNDGYPSFLLMRAKVRVRNFEECKRLLKNIMNDLGDKTICAGSSSGSSVCYGDSGGPLMLWWGRAFYVIAVASAGPECVPYDGKDLPAVFTRVDKFKDWITENMK